MTKYFRTILIILMIACYGALNAQYVNALAPDSIDKLVVTIEDQYRVSNLESPKLASDKLLGYWENQKEDNSSEFTIQNYYYALTQNLILSNALDLITKDSVDEIIAIGQAIKKDLPNNNITLAKFYYLISELQGKVLKNASRRIEYLEKSLQLYQIEKPISPRDRLIVLNALGNAHRLAKEYDKARPYIEHALDENKQMDYPDTATLITTLYNLGEIDYQQNKFERGIEIAMEGHNLAVNYLEKEHTNILLSVRQLGIMYAETGDFKSSLGFAEKVIKEQTFENGEREKGISQDYSSLSRIHYRLGDIRLANVYIDSAIIYARRDTQRIRLSAYIHNKAGLTEDFDKAIALYELAIEICNENKDCPNRNKGIMLQNLGNKYYLGKNLQKALNYVTQAKIIKESDYKYLGVGLPATYGSLALINAELGNINLAIEYQEKSLKTTREFRPVGSFYDAIELSRLGQFYTEAGKQKEATKVLLEAVNKLEETVGSKNEQTIYTYRRLSILYRAKGQYNTANQFAKKSMTAAKSMGLNINEQLNTISDLYILQGNLDSAKVYMDLLFIESGVSLDDIENNKESVVADNPSNNFAAYMYYLKIEERIYGREQPLISSKIEKGIKLIDDLRSDFFFKSSENEFQKVTREFFNWSLGKLSYQYSINSADEILELIFQCMEKSKSITINRNFVRRSSIWEGDLPPSVIEEEKRIIEDYNINYDKYKRTSEGDSLKDLYADNMYQLELQQSDFLSLLQKEYPRYYNNRYDQNVASIQEAAQIVADEDLGMMILHWGDTLIYRFLITPSDVNFKTIQSKDIEPDLIKIEQILNDQEAEINEADFEIIKSTFIESSRSVYLSLFETVDLSSIPFDLFIIPDGRFVKLPFEILITKPHELGDRYGALSYLLRNHAISYSGTATELTKSKVPQYIGNKELYGGFAPQYKVDTSLLLQDSLLYKSHMSPLLYNLEEVQKSADLFNGDVFLGAEASENLFQERSKSYRILHLAMHTSLNDQYPMESYLRFTSDTSQAQDGQLYVNEIAQMNLNSDLVVLSACETNNGNDFLGEGVLGIAKAFQLASCSNMVLSNWLVDDRSSSKIIFSFFNYLSNSESPSHALRKAKLEFLDQNAVTYTQPKYWAAFAYYGNQHKLDFKGASSNSLSLNFVLFCLAIIGFLGCSFFLFGKYNSNLNLF